MDFRPILDRVEGDFVGEVIAEKCGRIQVMVPARLRASASGFIEDGHDCCAFVAARAQLEAGFEFKQTKASSLGERLEEGASAFLDDLGSRGRCATPMHDDGVEVYVQSSRQLTQMTQLISALQLCGNRVELFAGFGRQLLELATTVGVKALGAMKAPDLRRGFDAEQGEDFRGRATSDDDDLAFCPGFEFGSEYRVRRPTEAPESDRRGMAPACRRSQAAVKD